MFFENGSLLQSIERLEDIVKANTNYNDNPFFGDSIIIGANLGDDNDSYICNSVNIRCVRDINKNALLISRSTNTSGNKCYIFPYNEGEQCPGFCIVPKAENTIIITEKLSGCAIYIYNIGEQRIYVHFGKKHNRFQFDSQTCKNYLAQKIYNLCSLRKINNTYFTNIDEIKKLINKPSIKIEHKEYHRIYEIKEILRDKYKTDKNVFCEYSPIIYQTTGKINIFFFPAIYLTEGSRPAPEGNFLLQINGEKKTVYSINSEKEVNCCNIF